MNKAEAQARLDILLHCLRQLPDEANVYGIELRCYAHQDKPSVHIADPLTTFDLRMREDMRVVRYARQIGEAWVFWLADERAPEGI